jgi:hypothetical protein
MGKPTEDKEVAKWELEQDGVYNFKELYKHIHDWWADLGYEDVDGFGDKFEKFYFERQSAGGKNEHWMWWRLKKTPKAGDYFKYVVSVDIQTSNMSKVDVLSPRGKKVGSYQGDMVVRCEAHLQIDPEGTWMANPILKHFYRWFRYRAYLAKVKACKKELYTDCYNMHTWIKEYLKTILPKSATLPHP